MARLQVDDARAFLTESGVDVDTLAPQVEDKFASAFIRAQKPASQELLRSGVLRMSRPIRACLTGCRPCGHRTRARRTQRRAGGVRQSV